jgi:thioredoxin reductase (NADPH)
VLEAQACGGQMNNAPKVENYPGVSGVSGAELASVMRVQAEAAGAEFAVGTVTGFDFTPSALAAFCGGKVCGAKALVLAMGTERRALGVPGEERLAGRGVSYCAVCDGFFFRGKNVAVAGGGDTALQDALYLSAVCAEVTLIHRGERFRARARLCEEAKGKGNIRFLMPAVIESLSGESALEGLTVRELTTGAARELAVSGLFAAVGMKPRAETLGGAIALGEGGFVLAGEDTRTNVPGVFAAGDIRAKGLRQIVTACADGAAAAAAAAEFLR